MKLKNGKGLFTSVCTLITLILTLVFTGALISFSSLGTGKENGGWIIILIFAVISLLATVYLYWHGIKILFGVDRNTWLYVFVSFFAFFFGGVLMLIAKILD